MKGWQPERSNRFSLPRGSGGTGRRTSLRGWRSQDRRGSNPLFRTIFGISRLQHKRPPEIGGRCGQVFGQVWQLRPLRNFEPIEQRGPKRSAQSSHRKRRSTLVEKVLECLFEDPSAEIMQGRSDRASSPCPTPPQSRAQTPAGSRHMHRLPRWPGAGS